VGIASVSFLAGSQDVCGETLASPGLQVKGTSYYDSTSSTSWTVHLFSFQNAVSKHPSANRIASGRQNADTTFSIQAYVLKACDENLYCGLGTANFTSVKPVVAGMTNKTFGATTSSKVYRKFLISSTIFQPHSLVRLVKAVLQSRTALAVHCSAEHLVPKVVVQVWEELTQLAIIVLEISQRPNHLVFT
jgi:hypothetical protein